jgi:hypothetical protein
MRITPGTLGRAAVVNPVDPKPGQVGKGGEVFGCTCYHPLFVFNQFGDLERCSRRPGNVHSAHDWRDVLEPVVARYRDRRLRR